MKFEDISEIEKWSKEDLTIELRSFELYTSEANEAMCAALSKRGVSDEEINEIYPLHPVAETDDTESNADTFRDIYLSHKETVGELGFGLFGLVAFVSIIIGLLCLMGSTFTWLKDGVWNPVESVWVLKTYPGLQDWLTTPDSWFGLHKVVDFIIDAISRRGRKSLIIICAYIPIY